MIDDAHYPPRPAGPLRRRPKPTSAAGQRRRADDAHSLQPGTAAWGRLGATDEPNTHRRGRRLVAHPATAPHARRSTRLLATAKAQRWEPAEAMRALLTEELAGRQASSIRARRKAAGFPTAKTFDAWDETVSSIPAPTQRALRTLEWIDRHENLVVCGPSPTAKTTSAKHSATPPSTRAQGHLVQPRAPRSARAPPGRRRHRRQSHPPDHARRRHRERRHRTAAGHHRHRRGALPRGRRRLRETLHRPVGQPSPAGFDELMPKTIANATVDRLLHEGPLGEPPQQMTAQDPPGIPGGRAVLSAVGGRWRRLSGCVRFRFGCAGSVGDGRYRCLLGQRARPGEYP